MKRFIFWFHWPGTTSKIIYTCYRAMPTCCFHIFCASFIAWKRHCFQHYWRRQAVIRSCLSVSFVSYNNIWFDKTCSQQQTGHKHHESRQSLFDWLSNILKTMQPIFRNIIKPKPIVRWVTVIRGELNSISQLKAHSI